MELITIDNTVALPIYKQIIKSVHEGIQNGSLKHGDLLPSVNQIAAKFSLARGSVFTAYNELRASGIIDSIPGKGYFVASTQVKQVQNIFLLFSTFTPYKEVLYNAFLNKLDGTCNVDIYFHHHNIKIFDTIIREQASYYNTFVVMPEVHEKTAEILSQLDPKRTYLLDVGLKEYGKQFPGICQNFEKDIFSICTENIELLKKYKRLVLVFPPGTKSNGIVTGFKKFTRKNDIDAAVVDSVKQCEAKKGDCYVVIDDNDLVHIIKKSNSNKLKLGQDIGVISYNETELKSIIAEGITTITTDFEHMGSRMAEMILNNETVMEENPFLIIKRKSV
ncbi:GntR family transcriptional regulator [Chitinophaga barathri]|uniref:GntR family transcriptional regulator n=1 Tax=Chitinophaga barathri TaxID=1647451 RepID=A0A3N4MTW6_9BACT|nr:GntR family transcriptional regulator [Chitinophaga barathri]RPD42989.1 GntR family transcriptional regulator [Chitinophaga barathri]